jgi:hypothetical protein
MDAVKKIIEDLGIEIDNGEDALFVIGRLDALASALISHDAPKKKPKGADPLFDVLRALAKKQKSKRAAKLLRTAARRTRDLLDIAGEVSYGMLHENAVKRAERIRGNLYETLYEWSETVDGDED